MNTVLPEVLYHFTCTHRARSVAADRELHPTPHPWLGHALVWLTDLNAPDRAALGLTSATLSCDRTAVRASVRPDPSVMSWPLWARQARVPALVRAVIEGGSAVPTRWWVSPASVAVHDLVGEVA